MDAVMADASGFPRNDGRIPGSKQKTPVLTVVNVRPSRPFEAGGPVPSLVVAAGLRSLRSLDDMFPLEAGARHCEHLVSPASLTTQKGSIDLP